MSGWAAGKVAVVTGGASGIGRAGALEFAKAGAKVVVADVDVAGGEETVKQIRDMGGEAIFVRTDVSKEEDVKAMVEAAEKQFGGLDYAFNNAGIEGQMAPTAEYTLEAWNKVIGINLTGVWLCMRYEIPVMLRRGGGAIVNTASVAGLVGFPSTPAYTASKHGVVGLTKAAAIEYGPRNIRVNAICPGVIETPMVMSRSMQLATNREAYQQMVALHPLNRLGTAEEVAKTAVWLCSPDASFITGAALPVDGGFVSR